MERITSVSITRILTDIKPRTVRCESEVLPQHQVARLGQSGHRPNWQLC